MNPTPTAASLPEVLVDLTDLKQEAYHNPTIVTALALVSIAADVRALREHHLHPPQTLDVPAVDEGRPSSCLPCVNCVGGVVDLAGLVEHCTSCGSYIAHPEAQAIRARVEQGAGS